MSSISNTYAVIFRASGCWQSEYGRPPRIGENRPQARCRTLFVLQDLLVRMAERVGVLRTPSRKPTNTNNIRLTLFQLSTWRLLVLAGAFVRLRAFSDSASAMSLGMSLSKTTGGRVYTAPPHLVGGVADALAVVRAPHPEPGRSHSRLHSCPGSTGRPRGRCGRSLDRPSADSAAGLAGVSAAEE